MIAALRILLALTLFSSSLYFIYDTIVNEFNGVILIAAVLGFLLIPWVWPKIEVIDSKILDSLEFLIEIPFHIITFLPRTLLHILKEIDF